MQILRFRNVIIIELIIMFSIVTWLIYNAKPGSFSITNFNQEIGEEINLLTWSKSKRASKYKVFVSDVEGNVIKEATTANNSLVINDLDIKPNDAFIVDIKAYSKNNKQRKVDSPMTYTWKLPIIQIKKKEIPILDDDDISDSVISILDNDFKINDYYVVINKNNKDIYENKIIENNIKVSANVFKELSNSLGTYEILLCKDYEKKRLVLSKTILAIVPLPITDIVVTKPLNDTEVPWQDVVVNFAGGKYANAYTYTIKDDSNKVIISNVPIEIGDFTISKDKLKPNTKYKLIITAYHMLDQSVTKVEEFNFSVARENKVSQIIPTRPSGEIGINRPIRLKTNTEATIYYTTDGSKPNQNSILYTGSIFIDEDMTVKAIAVADGMIDSDIIELNYKVVEKDIAIYLSPSVQDHNLGISKAGYTTEMKMMNKIADFIEERLNEKGIIVYRNNPDMTLSQIVNNSSSYDVDMHLAIHSNDYNGSTYGVETWVHNETCEEAEEIAEVIQNSLMSIYYNPKGNRGIKYSENVGGMRETNPKNVTNGVLVEVAFHDYYNDAKWIVDNQKKIGYKIADAVANYYKK